jgi:hypothetical protein
MSRQYQRWSPAAVELLRTLWPDHSGSIIAARLTAECGMTVRRGTVGAQARRLKIKKGGPNVKELPGAKTGTFCTFRCTRPSGRSSWPRWRRTPRSQTKCAGLLPWRWCRHERATVCPR